MSNTHTTYKLDEAQAIMNELRTIRKAICTGEKERRDLMQVGVRPLAPSLGLSLFRISKISYLLHAQSMYILRHTRMSSSTYACISLMCVHTYVLTTVHASSPRLPSQRTANQVA